MEYKAPLDATDPNAPYHNGQPDAGIEGSAVPAEAIEPPQREIVNVITAAGMTPSGDDTTQLAQAIAKMVRDGAVDLTPILRALETHEFATLTQGAHGFTPGADGTVLTSRAGAGVWEALVVPQPYILCEFYTLRHPTPPSGFLARNGAVIANADRDYPAAYAYLQTPAGKQLCKTLAAWEALSTTAGGVGGVPWFVLDTAAKTIKLPDTRGDYVREAGYKSMTVGGWHTDKMQGHWHAFYSFNNSGEFGAGNSARRIYNGVANNVAGTNDIIRQAIADNANSGEPRIGDETQTRAHHLLGCVYLGGV